MASKASLGRSRRVDVHAMTTVIDCTLRRILVYVYISMHPYRGEFCRVVYAFWSRRPFSSGHMRGLNPRCIRTSVSYVPSACCGVCTALSVLSIMESLPCDIITTCTGQAGGVATLLLAAGTPGLRRAFPTSRISLQQVEGNGPSIYACICHIDIFIHLNVRIRVYIQYLHLYVWVIGLHRHEEIQVYVH